MARENTKQQILEAAVELFSEKGFEAASMSEIADTVGIKKASLYCHYNALNHENATSIFFL